MSTFELKDSRHLWILVVDPILDSLKPSVERGGRRLPFEGRVSPLL